MMGNRVPVLLQRTGNICKKIPGRVILLARTRAMRQWHKFRYHNTDKPFHSASKHDTSSNASAGIPFYREPDAARKEVY